MLIPVLGMVIMLSSCSKVPQAEIDAANVAIEQAQMGGADLYLPVEFNALQDSMKVVNEMIESRKGKMFAGFGDVKTKLTEINTMAETLKANTETRKAEVQGEAEALLAEVTTLIEQSKALLANAPKGKEGKAAVEAIGTEISTVEATLAEATAMVAEAKYVESLDKLNAAKEKITAVITELQTVIEKIKK